jgi:hypothetical protein
VSYLLQRMETFKGLAILATNRKTSIDAAFMRRLRFVVDFPPPGATEREDLWRRALSSAPSTGDIDYCELARFEIDAEHIAAIAASAGQRPRMTASPVAMADLMAAARAALLTPGVYVEELPSGHRSITGVSTSITAFVGRTVKGPVETPTRVTSVADFDRLFGGLSPDCPLSYAVQHFFLNGGTEAVIARIAHRDSSGAANETAPITDADLSDPILAAQQRGLWSLDQVDLVNLLCIPPLSPTTDVGRVTWDAAIDYARSRRAFVIVDPPAAWTTVNDATAGLARLVTRDANAALYFPRICMPDPLHAGQPGTFATCGAVAGVYARTDATRGVWKGPAGNEATLLGVTGLALALTSAQSGVLNTEAVNSLRSFPARGSVVWGARTLAGADALASEWKYVPVVRTALFIEESIARGTRWVVFEPNAEPLWAQIRVAVDEFLQTLFRDGAFQGRAPREAYFVKCDAATTTRNDIDLGIVNLLVGFAASKPAEFIVLRLALRAAAAAD